METKVYSKEGKETGKVKLSELVFGVAWNADLVHEVVVSMQSNARAGTAHTKDRSEVRGGGRKPWKQKGTGRARHGSRRSPIWAGGGVTFGPRNEKDYSKKINKNVKSKALASVLTKKYTDGEMIFVDSVAFEAPKTTEAKKVIEALSGVKGYEGIKTKKINSTLLVLPSRDENTEMSFQNFGNISVMQAKDVNPVELLTYKYVVVVSPEATNEIFETRIAKKKNTSGTESKDTKVKTK